MYRSCRLMRCMLAKQAALYKSRCLVDAEHDIHVLDSCAGSTFAEIIEKGGDAGLLLVAADDDPQLVGAGQLVGINSRAVCAKRHDGDEMRVLVVFLQLLADILRSRSSGQQAVVQHDRCSHSLVIVIHNREENRGGFQAAPAESGRKCRAHRGPLSCPRLRSWRSFFCRRRSNR